MVNVRWAILLGGLVGALTVASSRTATAAIATFDSVYVVPNPYNVSGRTYGPQGQIFGYERIRFANLPDPNATSPTLIKIFTTTFNLVTTLEHTNDNDYFWDGRNSDNQYIVSGIYIYVIKHPDFGTTYGKFIVIR